LTLPIRAILFFGTNKPASSSCQFTSTSASAFMSSAGLLRLQPHFPLPLAAVAFFFAARFARGSLRSL